MHQRPHFWPDFLQNWSELGMGTNTNSRFEYSFTNIRIYSNIRFGEHDFFPQTHTYVRNRGSSECIATYNILCALLTLTNKHINTLLLR